MSFQQKICTFCLNSGKDKKECYGHFPGPNCPTLAEVECTRCKQKGHTRSKCDKQFCKFCKQFGHNVDDCQELKDKKEVDKDKYCSFCGEQGHTQNRCQSPYNYKNRSKYH